jgi:hypothetical protein
VGYMVFSHLPRKAVSMESSPTLTVLDDTISSFVDADCDAGAVVTGWTLSVSVVHPALPGSDGYFVVHSPGLPYHSQLGLLHSALDEMNTTSLVNHLKGETS